MARIDAHLIRKGARVLNARKGRLLDLRGNRIAEIENLGATEDQFDMINLSDNEIVKLENFPHMNRLGTLLIKNNMITHINPTLGEFLPKIHTLVLTKNCLTTLAEIDPLASLPSLKVLSLLDNTVTKLTDYRLYVVHTLKHLTLLDFMKVKREERIAATNKFHSKESYEEVKKSGAKAYCPVHVGDTQYTIKEHGPKVVSPTSERIMAIKAAIVNSETLNEVARIKGASTTGQILSESVITKPDANVADSPEGTDKMETGLKNEADENKVESTPIQQERLGTGVDSLSINPPGQINEYIYSNFQRASLRFISSRRKRPFHGIHIIPPARLQLPGINNFCAKWRKSSWQGQIKRIVASLAMWFLEDSKHYKLKHTTPNKHVFERLLASRRGGTFHAASMYCRKVPP